MVAWAAMKAAAYSAAVAESMMIDKYNIVALGRAPCSSVPMHMKAPARDLALVSNSAMCTFRSGGGSVTYSKYSTAVLLTFITVLFYYYYIDTSD